MRDQATPEVLWQKIFWRPPRGKKLSLNARYVTGRANSGRVVSSMPTKRSCVAVPSGTMMPVRVTSCTSRLASIAVPALFVLTSRIFVRCVVRKLTELIVRHGKPGPIVSGKGAELTGNAVLAWWGQMRMEQHQHRPGPSRDRPWPAGR